MKWEFHSVCIAFSPGIRWDNTFESILYTVKFYTTIIVWGGSISDLAIVGGKGCLDTVMKIQDSAFVKNHVKYSSDIVK